MNCAQAGCSPIPPDVGAVHGPCHCAACHQTFGSLEMFDAHQDWADGWDAPVVCTSAEGLGLVRDHKGTWQTPEGLRARQAWAERLAERRRAS